ncbi:MAG TPA: 2Fe-2S iron-sulfur cluster-binding protein [Terriglobales bacterium]
MPEHRAMPVHVETDLQTRPASIAVTVNGRSVAVAAGATVAAAMMIAGSHCRTSVSGEPRSPLCGMGICFECRAMIDGVPHRRSCQMVCVAGMEIRTNE